MTGLTKEFLFSPTDSAAYIAQYVYDNWSEGESRFHDNSKRIFIKFDSFRLTGIASLRDEWSIEGVSRAEVLRLIYQGRFLHGNVTLGGEYFIAWRILELSTTHLYIRWENESIR